MLDNVLSHYFFFLKICNKSYARVIKVPEMLLERFMGILPLVSIK